MKRLSVRAPMQQFLVYSTFVLTCYTKLLVSVQSNCRPTNYLINF